MNQLQRIYFFLIKVKDLLSVADVRESKSVSATSGAQLTLILRT